MFIVFQHHYGIFFESELDIIAKECIPDVKRILAICSRKNIKSLRRGCDTLTNYIEIVKKALMSALNNGSSDSYLGRLREWTNNLPNKVLSASSDTFSSIAKAALHHSSDVIANKGSGCCQCGGLKY